MGKPVPVLLAILDGWGEGPLSESNAIYVARTPNMDTWARDFPSTTLLAHNGAVGLPEGQMGNSEVGHLNIGAGRIVYQDFTRINKAIETGEFYSNQVLVSAMETVRDKKSVLHFLGLVSDGGVHSHLKHLEALVKLASDKGVEKVYIHAFMDGRDTPPESGAGYIESLQKTLDEVGLGKIATISGRYYAMDRDNRWSRVEQAWHALVYGTGIESSAADPAGAVRKAYERGETDEFIKPIVLKNADNNPVATINDDDGIVFFNFRADRARQLTHAFTDDQFAEFPVDDRPRLSEYVTFTQYDKESTLPIAFPPQSLTRILGEEISRWGLKQLRIAETEKYAHVTYFFNGGREEPFEGEDRILVPSPKEVATYDLKPEMSAYQLTDTLLEQLANDYSLVVLNFANGDMVGHTGIMEAAVKACEAVDSCLGRLVEEFTGRGGVVLITADHGNAEMMYDQETHGPFTAHSNNPVPFILLSEQYKNCSLRGGGSLRDIAPTILTLLGIPVPEEMDGESLLVCNQ
jgi:2,3-bisphosphoglycerate-independent phosphoglycerate mutase